jgi:PleD family two-component response regulator
VLTVIAAVDDMFFASKIRATAKALGMVVNFPRTLAAFISLAGDEAPDLFIVDLHNARLDPINLATQLKSSETLKSVPLLGFFSHVNVDLQRQALDAGYDEVLPRSLFARDLAKILAGTTLNKKP